MDCLNRVTLELEEAKLWEILVRMPADSPLLQAKKREHAIFFSFLRQVEHQVAAMKTCVECHEKADKSCGKCHQSFYCSLSCQKLDWPRHKKVCCLAPHTRADNFAESFQPSPTPGKPYSVILVLSKGAVSVQMSKDDMMSYRLFLAAVKSVVPTFDEVKQLGWQHWQTVREAWNPYR